MASDSTLVVNSSNERSESLMLKARTGMASILILDTSGVSTPSGKSSFSIVSLTSLVASSISVSKSNSIWIEDAFASDDDMTVSTPSMFLTRCSSGMVTFSSTSFGAAPVYVVMTEMFGMVISGIVSCFILSPEYNPATITMTVKIQTANLLFSEKLIIFFKQNTPTLQCISY